MNEISEFVDSTACCRMVSPIPTFPKTKRCIVVLGSFSSKTNEKIINSDNESCNAVIYCPTCNKITTTDYDSKHTCKCGRSPDVIVNSYNTIKLEYSEIYVKDKFITLSNCFSIYKYLFTKNRVIVKQVKFNLTHNKETKNTFWVDKTNKKPKLRIIHLPTASIPTKPYKGYLLHIPKTKIFEWLSLITKDSYLNLSDKNLKLNEGINFDNVNNNSCVGLTTILMYIKYPALQNINFRSDLGCIPLKVRQKLKDQHSKQPDIYKVLAGRCEPSLIKLFEQKEDALQIFKVFGYAIKDVNHITNLIKNSDIRMFCNRSVIYNHSNEVEFVFKDDLAQLVKAIGSEQKFVNMILKDVAKPHHHIYQSLSDTIFMFQTILRQNDAYILPKHNSITSLHDELSLDLEKIKHKNLSFVYNDKVVKRIEHIVDNVEFKLPIDTHSLAKVGSELHNCVGSYKEYVLNYERLIVVGYQDNKVVVAIELRPSRETQNITIFEKEILLIKQAKIDHNNRPDSSLSHIIYKWADLVKAEDNSSDLDLQKDTNLEEVQCLRV